MYMHSITSTKTNSTKGLPGKAISTVQTTLMETEEGPERTETVVVAAETSNLAGATTTAKGSRDVEGSGSFTSPPGKAAIQQTASGTNRLNLNTKRLSGAQ
jgi:hypothetical protein